MRNWFGAVPESWKVTPVEPPQAEPDDEITPPVDWRQPVPTAESVRRPETAKLVVVAFVVVAFVALKAVAKRLVAVAF